VKTLLLVIALFLGTIAVRPHVAPPRVAAQSDVYPVYIEKDVVMLSAPDGRCSEE